MKLALNSFNDFLWTYEQDKIGREPLSIEDNMSSKTNKQIHNNEIFFKL